MIYGYHRVSTSNQKLDRGINEIEQYCNNNNLKLEKVFCDKMSGKTFDRPRWTVLKEDVLRDGDTLIVTELDRLGRTKDDTLNELRYLKEKNIRVMILELPTTLMNLDSLDNEMAKLMLSTINNMLIDLYASLAEAEMHKRKKRQQEGIQAMKDRGEWDSYGRPSIMSLDEFAKEYNNVLSFKETPTELMNRLGLSNSTFYRYVDQMKHEMPYKFKYTIQYDILKLNLSSRALNALIRSEIKSIERLESLSVDDLLRIDGIGHKGVNEIIEKLKLFKDTKGSTKENGTKI